MIQMKYLIAYIIFADNKPDVDVFYLRWNECHDVCVCARALCISAIFDCSIWVPHGERAHKIHSINLVTDASVSMCTYLLDTLVHVISTARKNGDVPCYLASRPSRSWFAPADSYEFQPINMIDVSLFLTITRTLLQNVKHAAANHISPALITQNNLFSCMQEQRIPSKKYYHTKKKSDSFEMRPFSAHDILCNKKYHCLRAITAAIWAAINKFN